MGKSRIIAAVVALKYLYDKTQNFNIVFTTELLRSVDEQKYTDMKTLLGMEVKMVVYNKDLPL